MKDTKLSASEVAKTFDKEINPALIDYGSVTEASAMTLEGFENHINASNKSLTKLSVKAKLTTVALNTLKAAALGLLVGFAYEGVAYLLNLIETPKKIAENAEIAKKNIDDLNDSLNKNNEFITTSKKRYAELAQGVDQLTGKNLKLSTEDYEEFLSLSNELATLFPYLETTFTNNGDAIVKLEGNVNDIVGSLDNLIDKERELANMEIAKNMPDLFKGTSQNVKDIKKEIENLEKEIVRTDNINKSKESNFYSNYKIPLSEDGKSIRTLYGRDENLAMSNLQSELNDRGMKYNKKDSFIGNQWYKEFELILTDEEYNEILREAKIQYEQLLFDHQENINKLNQEKTLKEISIGTEYDSLKSSINSWLTTESSYKVMSDDVQNIIQQSIDNIDWQSLDFSKWEEVEKYIRDNFLYIFTTGIDTTPLSTIFDGSMDNLSASEYIEKVRNIVSQIQAELKKLGVETDFNLDFLTNTKQEKLDRSYNKFNLRGSYVPETANYIKSLDEEELDILLGLDVDTSTPLEKIKQMIIDASKLTSDGITIDLSPIHTQLDEIQEAYKTVSDAITEYDENQALSLDTVQSLLGLGDQYLATLFDENGQLQLNTVSYDNLTKAKLQQLQVDMIANTLTLVKSLEDESAAKEYLKKTTLDLTAAKWEDIYATIEQARTDLMNQDGVDARLEALDQIEASTKAKEKLFKDAESSLSKSANHFYGAATKPGGGSSSKPNVFDWAANSISNLNRELDKLNDKLDDVSLEDKLKVYDELKTPTKNLVSSTKQAAKTYESDWKKKSSKISPTYKNQIVSGSTFKLESFPNEQTYQNVVDAQKAYEQWQDMLDTYNEALDKQKDNDEGKISTLLEIAQIKLDTLSSEDLESMTSKEKNQWLKDEKTLKKEILGYNLSLVGSEAERIQLQKEYDQYLKENEEQRYNNSRDERNNRIAFHDSKIQDIQNEIDLQEAQGGQGTKKQYKDMNSRLDSKIKWEQKNYDKAKAKRDKETYGSDEWEKYNSQMQEAENNINACTIAQIENNKAILRLPIKVLEDKNKELEKELKLQNEKKEKVESAIEYANYLIQEEIDKLNDSKESISDYYDDKIKDIQNERDAYTEVNDELQRQIDLENAKYNLEKAKRNRTTRVYKKDQGFVYEADQDAIRDAQADLDQQVYDNKVADFDKEIEGLNKKKETRLEELDNEIKSWEDYAELLNDVSGAYERLASKRNFLELFKTEGENGILSKDIGILKTIGNTLDGAKLEIDTIEKKMETNETTISNINEEAENFLLTTKTIEEAQKRIDELVLANEEEIEAIDERKTSVNNLGTGWTDTDTDAKTAINGIVTTLNETKKTEADIFAEKVTALTEFKKTVVSLYGEIETAVKKASAAFATMETTLANAKSTYEKILDYQNKSNSAKSANPLLGLGVGLVAGLPTFHSGGIVGESKKIPENLVALTDANLKPNETFAKLLNGEVVLNNTQMSNLFNNLNRAYTALAPLNKRENSPININIGDVNVYNPNNSDMIVDEIVKELPLKVIQRLHSK
jgi:hypothetical protein